MVEKRRIVTESLDPPARVVDSRREGQNVLRHPIRGAEYFLTVARHDELPPAGPPEIAFAGRSNAGKSSAINALADRTKLAYTSKTPGRTQQINFFQLRSGALLTDLPGYGYAAVPQALKKHWQDFLAHYLATRQSLIGLALVVDARRGLGDLDRQLLALYLTSGRPVLLLATKIDKLGTSAQREAERAIARDLATAFPAHASQVAVVPFSATHRIGIDAAEATLAAWLGDGAVAEGAASVPNSVLTPGSGPDSGGKKKRPRAQGE
jgi:GTP-binding protein